MTILIHDFYFYITHRLIHHPRLYRKVHAIHHYSLNPSPWASFSFHPFEACVQAGIVVVLAFVMPVHTYTLLLFSAFSFSMNIIGHLGYEYYPAWFKKIPIFKNLHSATSHNVHHAKYKGNYGLYFTWWDKLFKTEL